MSNLINNPDVSSGGKDEEDDRKCQEDDVFFVIYRVNKRIHVWF